MMFAPLDEQYQTLLSGPNQPFMYEAIAAAGITIECNNRMGWQAFDKSAAQAIIDDEAQWLPYAKAEKLESLSAIHRSKIADGFAYAGKVIQIRDEDIRNIQAQTTKAMLCLNGQQTWNTAFAWIAADNTMLPLPAAQDMVDMGLASGAYVEALIFANFSLKRTIEAASSKAALDLIDLNAGWPTN